MKTKIFFSVISILLIVSNGLAQDITNTLGASGVFKVKDGSTDYLSLSQSTGYLTLNGSFVVPQTINSTTGVIYKDIERFLHNYQADGTDGVNTFLGLSSGNFTMSGTGTEASYNTGIGVNALYSLTTGNSNVALGVQSLFLNTSGNNNTAIGNSSLRTNTGDFNTAVGSSSLYSNTDGNSNTALGFQSLSFNTTGFYNTATGVKALYSNTTGLSNTANGKDALYSNTTGFWNTAIGDNSLYSNTTGYSNTSNGNDALYFNTTGVQNTANGRRSLYSNTIGNSNTANGDLALWTNTTGSNNTALGTVAGSSILSGNNLTCIGFSAQPTSGTATNQITLGNNQVTSLRCNVTTITSLSDVRDKKNITDLTLGLDFITKLKPRQFNWDKREWYDDNKSNGSKMKEEPTAGFIAQEFDEIQNSENAEWLNLVLKDNPDKWEATYGNLLPVIVKAIQELSEGLHSEKIKNEKEITKLTEENKQLRSEVADLKSIKEHLTEIQGLKEELIDQIHNLKASAEEQEVKFSSAGNQKEE